MLTVEAARRRGVNACIDKLGRDFVLAHRETSSASYAVEPDENGDVFCFVGVDDRQYDYSKKREVLVLDGGTPFPYRASCNVNINNESVVFTECVLP